MGGNRQWLIAGIYSGIRVLSIWESQCIPNTSTRFHETQQLWKGFHCGSASCPHRIDQDGKGMLCFGAFPCTSSTHFDRLDMTVKFMVPSIRAADKSYPTPVRAPVESVNTGPGKGSDPIGIEGTYCILAWRIAIAYQSPSASPRNSRRRSPALVSLGGLVD